MSIKGFLTTDGVQKYDWEALENKPFGEVIGGAEIVYDETRTVNELLGCYQYDPIGSLDYLLGAVVKRAATDTDGVTAYFYSTVYPQIFDGSEGESEDLTEDNFIAVDMAAAYGEAALAGVYQVMSYGGDLGFYVVMQDVTQNGETVPAGVYLPPKQVVEELTVWVESITIVEYSKLDRKFLPDDIVSSGGGGTGAYLLDLTEIGAVIGGDAVTVEGVGLFNEVVGAVNAHMPILVRGCTTIDGNLDETPVSFVVSASDLMTVEGVTVMGAIQMTGVIIRVIDEITRVLHVQVVVYNYAGAYTMINTIIDDVAGCGTSPASNIKYIDFGAGDIDISNIDYSQYTAGDLIILVQD